MQTLTINDLEALAIGAGILGTGGGGNPYLGKLRMRQLLQSGHTVRIVPPEALSDTDLVAICAGIGAPTIGIEKLENGLEVVWALLALEREHGHRIAAIIPAEIGGANSIEPLIAGALTGLPVVDADGMGRAFPEVQMTTFFIYGVRPDPVVLCDEKGNEVIIRMATDAQTVERLARAITIQMGGAAAIALAPMSGADVRRTAIPRTLSLCIELGMRVLEARRTHANPVATIQAFTHGKVLIQGKIVDVRREFVKGFARGMARVQGLGQDRGRELVIEFQNENLIAWEGQQPLACVPDLICVVAQEDGEPITTEQLRYGQRVTVLAIPCAPLLRRPEALEVVGPAAFGYPIPYTPLEGTGPWGYIQRANGHPSAVHVD